MIRYDSDVENIKHNVLLETAKFYFQDLDEQVFSDIPYKIIPGMLPRYRCCVFKEREILRQRLLLARGKKPIGNDTLETINIIKEACHGCPINRFQVTPNCQKCLAKSCIKACRFGAIAMGVNSAFIDQSKCKECGKCVTVCPYNAITDLQRPCVKSCPVNAVGYDSDKLAVIDSNKCILCGNCIKGCPFGAISESSEMADVIVHLKNKEDIIALVAPAIEGQFGQVNLGGILNAIKQLGFSAVHEVSIGADAVANSEAAEVLQNIQDGKTTLTSCCPAFYNLVEKHFPVQLQNVSTTVSPMIAVSRLVKSKKPNAKVVFIGPCFAKKGEAKRDIEGNVDYVIAFEELDAMLLAKNITLENADFDYSASRFGREFASSGGVAAAVCKAIDEKSSATKAVCQIANGASECIKALNILKAGKLNVNLLEGMACEGGCIAGPATLVSPQNCRKNKAAIANATTTEESIINSTNKNQTNTIYLHRHNK